MNDLLARLWRLGRPLQWRFLWVMHSKFICGITGVVRDDDGRVLLLRHRLWPPSRRFAREVISSLRPFVCLRIVLRWKAAVA
jgi:hypothetical protein